VQHDRQLPPRRTSQEPGLGLALIAAASMSVVLLLALIGLVSTGWGPLRTVDLNIVRSLTGYISGHRAQLQFWTMVSLLFGPVVLPIAVLLVAALLWFRGLRRSAFLLLLAGAVYFAVQSLDTDQPVTDLILTAVLGFFTLALAWIIVCAWHARHLDR